MIILVSIVMGNDNAEHMTSTEAITAVASIYNTDLMTVKAMNITDKISCGSGTSQWTIQADPTKNTMSITPGTSAANAIVIGNDGSISANTMKVRNLQANTSSIVSTPVYILNTEINAAINVFTDRVEYPGPNDQLKWYVEYRDDYGGTCPANALGDWWKCVKGKYMTFKNLSNGQYLGTSSGAKGDRLTTIPTVEDKSLWMWKGSYIASKAVNNYKINIYRTINSTGDANKIVLWDEGWKQWQYTFTLMPALY